MTERRGHPSIPSVLSLGQRAAEPGGTSRDPTRWDVAARHSEACSAPSTTIHNHAFWLQNGCRTRSERRDWRKKSLQMSGSAYGIRTRVTAVRGTPSEAQIGSRKGIGLASQHDCHRLVPSPTGDLGCSVFPRRRQGAPGFEPGPSSFSGRLSCRMEPAFLFSWH